MLELIDKLKSAKNLIIYGAGIIAKNLYVQLKNNNIAVNYFAITDGNTKMCDDIDGVPVKFISELANEKENSIVIIGTSSKYHLEIYCNLYKIGFSEIYYSSNELLRLINGNNEKYIFEDRKKNKKNMCMVLAGYKDFLWDNVFKRLKKYVTEDIDVCVMSSGLYSDRLSKICEENNWSYLSMERNCLTLIQNIAIEIHPKAEMIFKLDEDIFVTENYFTSMLDTYNYVLENSYYNIGFVAPLIPVNGYGHVRVLEKLNLIDVYKNKFGVIKHDATDDYSVVKDVEVAKFLWGEGGFVPKIDEISKELYDKPLEYSVCPIRFSIGAVLFSREFWEKIGKFTQNDVDPCLGEDERNLCCESIWNSCAMIIDENILVGHLSFGQQNAVMKEYYLNHPERFNI